MTTVVTSLETGDLDVLAAGAVLWRPGPSGVELALVHRPRYDDWTFPKGKLDAGESMPVAAVREVAEETGYACRLGPLLADVGYRVPEGAKLVRYWAAEARGGEFVANDESDDLCWVGTAEAAQKLSYDRDRGVLRRFVELGAPHSVVVLVRHAKAGSRSNWNDDDDLRPLSRTGLDQARGLTELLPLFGPDRVCSAPPVRCRDTVAPTADALGLPVTEEPRLGEEGYWADPPGGLARLRELAAAPGVTVISSQGGVIPDLVGLLAVGRSVPGIDPDDVPSRKASTWLLTFGIDGLRAADYYPYPAG